MKTNIVRGAACPFIYYARLPRHPARHQSLRSFGSRLPRQNSFLAIGIQDEIRRFRRK
jgi:hypothetical protein